MEIQELYDILVGTLFPKDITDHFRIVHVEPLPDVLVVHFEEKDDYHDKEAGHEYVPNGFYEASRINDFPIRDRKQVFSDGRWDTALERVCRFFKRYIWTGAR